jgi:hypothetical protein
MPPLLWHAVLRITENLYGIHCVFTKGSQVFTVQ